MKNFRYRKTHLTGLMLLFTLACLLPSCASGPAEIQETEAYADCKRLWSEFRAANPYNVQTVGLKSYSDGSYNILITEPSEEVYLDLLQRFIEPYNGSVMTCRHPIGYDGYLEDVVLSFNKAEDLAAMRSSLFDLLYCTDYKAEFLALDDGIPAYIPYSPGDLNISVSDNELNEWLLGDSCDKFSSADGHGNPATLESILDSPAYGLFYSTNPGIVAWKLPRYLNDYVDFLQKARMFALDTDLILGAIKIGEEVAVIAREREASLQELPPLRPDMLGILATTVNNNLGQSFQRNVLLAGKQDNNNDWAPIWLSDDLWHTEFGNLLNITDQMLKSWSENGKVEYVRFPYPKPSSWAFAKGAISDLGASSLTYNWNTGGTGSIAESGDTQIYTLARTGSLPVTYIPNRSGRKVAAAEELAYDFFSGLSNTALVRVVQYTAMYQIFRNLKPEYGSIRHRVQGKPEFTPEITAGVNKFITAIRNYDKERDSVLDLVTANMRGLDSTVTRRHPEIVLFDRFMSHLNGLFKEADVDHTFCRTLADSLAAGYGNVMYTTSAAEMFRSGVPSIKMTSGGIPVVERRKSKKELIADILEVLDEKRHAVKLMYGMYDSLFGSSYYKNLYIRENGLKSGRWQKCPSIVESRNTDEPAWSGGHNIDAAVSRHSVSLKTASAPAQPARARSEAIGSRPRATRGFDPATQMRLRFDGRDYERDGRRLSLSELFNEIGLEMARGDEAPFKEIVIENFDAAGVDVRAIIDGAAYRMPRGSNSEAAVVNYDFNHITTEINGSEAIVRIPFKAGRLDFGKTADGTTSGFTVKEGHTECRMHKSLLQRFLDVIKQYVQRQRERINRFRLQREMRRHGISPADIREITRLRIAMYDNHDHSRYA